MPLPDLSHAVALSSGAGMLWCLTAALRHLLPGGIPAMLRARSANRIEATARDLIRADPETALAMLRITRGTQERPALQDSPIPQDRPADVPADSPP